MERDRIVEGLRNHGYAARLTSLAHIDRVRDRIQGLREQGLLNETFYNDNLAWARYDYREIMPQAGSVLVAASPERTIRLHFRYGDRELTALLPPTYTYSDSPRRLEGLLDTLLGPGRYAWAGTVLKTLAVNTGLARYGRNNICYVEGMGSFVRLSAYYTDIPCDDETVDDQMVMPECASCRACLEACPTGSIREDRFLIDAERCLAHFNESGGAFPEWIEPGWHNAIVGCMKCQAVCPKNKAFLDQVGREVSFSAEETGMILDKTPWDNLPQTLREKLAGLDMKDYYDVLERNLRALMEQ